MIARLSVCQKRERERERGEREREREGEREREREERERERENDGGMAYPAYPCLGSTHIHFQPCHQKGNHTMPRRCKLFGPEADSMLQSKVREEKGIHNYNEPPCFELLWPPSTEDG